MVWLLVARVSYDDEEERERERFEREKGAVRIERIQRELGDFSLYHLSVFYINGSCNCLMLFATD